MRARPMISRPFIAAVALLLGDCTDQTHWVVARERNVTGLRPDTTILSTMVVPADSGPPGASARLRIACERPRDPTPSLVLIVGGLVLDHDTYGFWIAKTRTDAGSIVEERWFTSDGSLAITSRPDLAAGQEMYQRSVALWHARVLRVEVPSDGERVVFRFPVAGYDTAFGRVQRACR